MGYKTIKFAEFDDRVQQYWLPSDFDRATVSAEVAGIAQGWNNQGFIQLVFDDATQVLTQVNHKVGEAYQEVWATGQQPAAVVRAANEPSSFDDMWFTYKGWNDYLEYAQQRYMTESTNFLVAVEEYRQSPSVPKQLELYARFVAEDAPEQVNIDGEVRQAIEARADGGADVFDAAQQAIMNLLRQDFDKFLTWYRSRG